MRVVENKELPTFSEGIRGGGEGLSKLDEDGEHTLVKPTVVKPEVVKPALVPQISFSLFASPEAQKALQGINDDESEDEEDDNGNDTSKVEINDGRADEKDHLKKSAGGIQSRYRWRVVTKTVAACSRASTTNSKTTTSPSRSLEATEESSPRRSRRGGLAPDHRCLSPAPPRSPRTRRMSLSPCRHPLLPNRPISPAPLDIHKTSSDPNLEIKNSSDQELKSELNTPSSPSSPTSKIDVTEGNPAIARALSRRRLSLPVSSRTHLIPPHPPSPSPRRRLDRLSPANSTGSSSPTPSTSSTSTKRPSSVTSTLQSNREKLEALMKERSRAIANLKIGHVSGSRESIPSPSSVKSNPMSPAPIRAKYSLAPASLSRKSSLTSEPESEASQPDITETISLLDGEAVSLDAMVADVIDMDSDVMSVKSESAASPRRLTASPLRLVGGGRPVFQRRGSCSFDSGISLSDTASVASEHEAPSSINHLDDEMPRMARLRNRRGTICVGSLKSLLAPTSAESNMRSSSSSPRPMYNLNLRSTDDIEEEVEEELQKRIMQRKSQLLIQAAPGSFNMTSAVSRLEARANCKTTNGRLKKIMGNLTLERTTSELLSMKAAMNAASKRREAYGIQKSKSLDCD